MPILGHCWSMVFGTFSRLCLDAFKRTGTNGRTLNVVSTQTEIQCSIAVLREVGDASAFPARPLVPGGHLPRTPLFSINNPKHHAVAFSFRFSSRVPLIHLCDTSTLILDRSVLHLVISTANAHDVTAVASNAALEAAGHPVPHYPRWNGKS
jgi:hypothetical protein